MASATIVIRLCDRTGGYGRCLCELCERFGHYEIIILDTTPSNQRKVRHCRTLSDFDVNFVYTNLRDAVELASHDYIAVLDIDELPSDLSKINAVRREYIDLEDEE